VRMCFASASERVKDLSHSVAGVSMGFRKILF
jgi:hypothetical protein